MIAAIGALSGGTTVGSESVDYVARIAELRRQLAAIQRRLAQAANGGTSELSVVTQQSLAQQVVALQAHIAVLQLPHVPVTALPAVSPASPPAASAGAPRDAAQGSAHGPTPEPMVWGHVDREA
ncbi:MAG: hypothetical protein KBF56_01760 [Gemmatimonadaceae bacterium]|nr:hypothetical protein [Gemmatimonadaceae bacterium]